MITKSPMQNREKELKKKIEYKIEKRPPLWQVKLETGCYSGYSCDFLVFTANSPEEVWYFLCEYMKETVDAQYGEWFLHSEEFGRYDLRKYHDYGEMKLEDGDEYYGGYRITIKQLEVVVIKNINLSTPQGKSDGK